MRLCGLVIIIVCTILPALADEGTEFGGSWRQAYLKVIVNGSSRGTHLFGIGRSGKLHITFEALSVLGIRPPPEAATRTMEGNVFYPLAELGLQSDYDATTQQVALEVPVERFTEQFFTLEPDHPSTVAESIPGAYMNYDVNVEYHEPEKTKFGSVLLDTGWFSSLGTLRHSGLARRGGAAEEAVRLETTAMVRRPEAMQTWELGDVISGSGPWWRSVRIGGLRLRRDFALRPDTLPFVLPTVRGQAVVPSTAELYVEDARVATRQVEPGPFEIREIPVITGSGELLLTVRDALGRERILRTPYYFEPDLLRPGLIDYDLVLGRIRLDFGQRSNAYGPRAAAATLRRGMTEWLSGTLHTEWTGSHAIATGGVTIAHRRLGTLELAVGTGRERGRDDRGAFGRIGLSRRSTAGAFGLEAERRTAGFRRLGEAGVAGRHQDRLRVFASRRLGVLGNFSASYQHVEPDLRIAGNRLAQVSWSRRMGGDISLNATVLEDLQNDEVVAMIGMSVSLGARNHVRANTRTDNGRSVGEVTFRRASETPRGYGYSARKDSAGRAGASLVVDRPWGHQRLEFARARDTRAGRISSSGGLVAMGGEMTATRRVHGSLALVEAGGIADVPVLLEHREVTRTGASGRAILTGLRGGEANRIGLEAKQLPFDVQFDRDRQVVYPPPGGGIRVDFGIERRYPILLRILTPDGKPLPPTAIVRDDESDETVPVGLDGRIFIESRTRHLLLEIQWENGRCVIQQDLPEQPGVAIARLGDVHCRRP